MIRERMVGIVWLFAFVRLNADTLLSGAKAVILA